MRLTYICDSCALEISSAEFHRKEDMFCTECGGLIEEVESSSPPEQDMSLRPLNHVEPPSRMVKCKVCKNLFSKRATKCPKCGFELKKICTVCENEIPAISTVCPECGDPTPFCEESVVNDNPSSPIADNYVAYQPSFWELCSSGMLNKQIVCPHCNKRGGVLVRSIREKRGISGGKATGALLTGGVSLLLTGLSRKERVTEATCKHCYSIWRF